MIAIRFQVFFIEPGAERPRMLSAISPMFSSPSAVETLTRTAKFEKRIPVVFSGEEKVLATLIQNAERLDIDKWLDLDAEGLESALKEEGIRLGLAYFDPRETQNRNEAPVLALSKNGPKYPPDLPLTSYALWDDIRKKYKSRIKMFETQDEKEAVQRILYTQIMRKRGQVPWTTVTMTTLNSQRSQIAQELMDGFEKWERLLETFERHLTSAGLLKRACVVKFYDSGLNHENGKYELVHEMRWILTGAVWKEVTQYLLKNEAFKPHGPNMLTLPIDKSTRIEVFSDSPDTLKVYIIHFLTVEQASVLTQEKDSARIDTRLKKIMLDWYKRGKIAA